MNTARKISKVVVQIEEIGAIDHADAELAFLQQRVHRKYLRNLVRMGPELARLMLHNDDFKRDPVKFINAGELTADVLYEKLVALDSK